ncbi:hypothetical protein FACS1894155_09430 [Bacteroidia bacterium]|nr:hypothetical protein FACS1894155_09430 [Bacteroidia bacterium]
MEQEIQILKLKDLILWTENPRDPIDENATDQDIVNKAMEDKYSKWSLPKLAKEMGDHYDFSELPTVVYHGKKPIVYDGNRRIILGKVKHNLVTVEGKDNNKPTLSHSFPSLIRMSLRLLCESAAKDINVTLDKYLNAHFANAKKSLEQDIKTSLSNQNVTEKTILQLLHTGAHNYQAANNLHQTYAISVILGEMLTLTHGKEN